MDLSLRVISKFVIIAFSLTGILTSCKPSKIKESPSTNLNPTASTEISDTKTFAESEITPSELNTKTGFEKTKQGRQLLKYIASCALKEEQKLTTTEEGKDYEFSGSMALAPEWFKQPLDQNGRRWVSACVLARVNAFGIPVKISMRGQHPALITSMTAEERLEHTVQEGAFYGNLFQENAVAYVCRGKGPFNPKNPVIKKRVCTEQQKNEKFTRCRFILTGKCQEVCEGYEKDDGYYTRCKAGDGVYEEVVTVYLTSQ